MSKVVAPSSRVAFPQGGSYFTTFPLTENPLSEGGRWFQGDETNSQIQTTGGNAFGTQAVSDPSGPFNDSVTEIPGFGANYEVAGTIIKAAGLNSVNREVEIRLRTSSNGPLRSTAFGNTRSNGYEITVQHAGAYMNLGRWKGANLAGLGDGSTPGSIGFTPATGDVFRARIQGQRIQVFYNNVSQIDFTDSDAVLGITSGNPGFGFFVNAGPPFPANTDFGYSDITVTAL